ncbi:hypothetical protein [Flavobacterium salmonis]|uniref:Uncharacterized protein n=1 Tax=Flavobacterium salmonis TaxID=2654844 RepID=A0A6V6YP69_9FLAO|nr:hypothetical protein [Flavobacterium salmonis]CAD0001288.1 hypothetical protein FLAT13_00476 [Flavobacterium salmonis]
MKNLLLFAAVFVLTCCDKDDDKPKKTPIEQLPPATQTGANTFGCLLDGEVFKPGITSNSYQCFYQYVNGGYYFNVNANNRSNGIFRAIIISTYKLEIAEGQILNLYERVEGNASGTFSISGTFNETSVTNTGELKITKLDFKNNIVSGAFWFDVIDDKGVLHQIREGRFDMQFTQ